MQTKQNKTVDKSPKNWFAIPVDIYSYLNPADEKLEMISFGRSTGWYILDTGGAIYVLWDSIGRLLHIRYVLILLSAKNHQHRWYRQAQFCQFHLRFTVNRGNCRSPGQNSPIFLYFQSQNEIIQLFKSSN